VRGYQAAYLSRWGSSTSTTALEKRREQPAVLLHALILWLDEAHTLSSKGLTAKTYSLVFENDGDEAVWARLLTAALMQMKMLESYHRVRMEIPPSRTGPHGLRSMLWAPSDLTDWLSDMLREIAGAETGCSFVHYEGALERLPLTEELDIIHRSYKECIDEWENMVTRIDSGFIHLEPIKDTPMGAAG
jgi:hypothetical protein